MSSRIRFLPVPAIQKRLDIPDQSQYPCMAMYLEGKVTQMGQRYLWRAQHRFAQRAFGAEIIALVGVRPWPSDVHVWQPILDSTARVLYVGGASDFEHLHKMRGTGRELVFVGERFGDCIDDLVSEM